MEEDYIWEDGPRLYGYSTDSQKRDASASKMEPLIEKESPLSILKSHRGRDTSSYHDEGNNLRNDHSYLEDVALCLDFDAAFYDKSADGWTTQSRRDSDPKEFERLSSSSGDLSGEVSLEYFGKNYHDVLHSPYGFNEMPFCSSPSGTSNYGYSMAAEAIEASQMLSVAPPRERSNHCRSKESAVTASENISSMYASVSNYEQYGQYYPYVPEVLVQRANQMNSSHHHPRPRSRNTIRVCHRCGTTRTPKWRRAPPPDRHILCNACGLQCNKDIDMNVAEATVSDEYFCQGQPCVDARKRGIHLRRRLFNRKLRLCYYCNKERRIKEQESFLFSI